MPAKSKAQQIAAGAALAAQKVEKPESELKGASRSMYDSMDKRQLQDFASTKQKGKPAHQAKPRQRPQGTWIRRGHPIKM